jgi:uncharacterized heparinase superfamily protein
MSPQEIPHRIAEAARRLIWRLNVAGWQAFEGVGDGELADLVAMRKRLAHYAAVASRTAVYKSVARVYEGRFNFLGEDWPLINRDKDKLLRIPSWFWFYDPITGKSWPDASTPSFDINVRSTESETGDVKYVWEPNRLQMLHPLAAIIARSDDERARLAGFAVIASWVRANPPYRGVNWRSTIEVALRFVSLTLFVAGLRPTSLSVDHRVMIRRLAVAHARFLMAFPSLYSSANNHRIAEGLGLFLAGALLPDLKEARAWLDEGRRIIEVQGERQILCDGVSVEQSPTYQAFSMELLAFAAQVAKDLGTPLSQNVIDRLSRGAEFLSWLADENGLVPAIGDDDEGRVIAMPPDREDRYVASIVAAVAGLTQRGNLAIPHDPHLRDVIFDSPQGSLVANEGLRVFERGGVSINNESINGRRIHLVFDHGQLGLLPLAAHGHADALAIWLTIDGEPVFVDAGTYRYFSGAQVRTALREGPAHNSLVIQELSPSRAATAFSWKTKANAHLVKIGQGEAAWSVTGAHDGYRKCFGVTHLRRIRRVPDGFAIDDQLGGNERCLPVTLRFLCDPAVAITRNDDRIMISGRSGLLCRVTAPDGFAVDVVEAVVSQRFGQLAPARQITFKGELIDGVATTSVAIIEPAGECAAPSHDSALPVRLRGDIGEAVWR